MGGSRVIEQQGPWAHQAPYLDGAFRSASQLFNIAPSGGAYPGYSLYSPEYNAPNRVTPQGGMFAPGGHYTGQVYGNNLGQGGQAQGGVSQPLSPAAFTQYSNPYGMPFYAGPNNPYYGAQQPRQVAGNTSVSTGVIPRGGEGAPAGARDVTPGGVSAPAGAYGDWLRAQSYASQGGGDYGGLDYPTGTPPNYQMASDLLAAAPRYYPGDTVADFTPEQLLAMRFGAQRAMTGSPLNQLAQGGVAQTLRGDYMNPGTNPYLMNALNDQANLIEGRVNQTAARYGREGSGAHLSSLTRELGNLTNQQLFQNYLGERGNQMSAYSMAPQLAGTDYEDLDRLMGYGQLGQDQAQREIEGDFARYQYIQESPYRQLANYMQLLGGSYGGSGMTMQPWSGRDTMDAASGVGGLGLGIGALAMLSSRRFKTDIEPIGPEFSNLQPVAFTWTQGPLKGMRDVGFIAEEVAEHYPELVVYEADGKTPLGVKYHEIAVRLAKCVVSLIEQAEQEGVLAPSHKYLTTPRLHVVAGG